MSEQEPKPEPGRTHSLGFASHDLRDLPTQRQDRREQMESLRTTLTSHGQSSTRRLPRTRSYIVSSIG
jgi:hypothetical protein